MLSASQCYPLHSQCSTVILSNSGADSAAFLTCFSCTAAVLQIEHELALWTGVADDELEDLNCGTELWHFFSGLCADRPESKNSLLFRTMACQPSSSTSHLDKLRSLALHGGRHGIKQNLRLHVATGKDHFETGRSWEIVANSCRETCGKSRQLKILQIRASSMEMQFGLNIFKYNFCATWTPSS